MSPIQWPGKITMPMGGAADSKDFASRWEETFGPKKRPRSEAAKELKETLDAITLSIAERAEQVEAFRHELDSNREEQKTAVEFRYYELIRRESILVGLIAQFEKALAP